MSAITGIYYLDNRVVSPAEIGRMTDALAHRGTDDEGLWYEGVVGLGHRMMWTTPESTNEHLPLLGNGGVFVITADARIDNRDELLSALNISSGAGEIITDTALILAAYEKWGPHCPEYMVGDFAFVIWDQNAQTLFCARDHFGVKPFYYYNTARIFTFASEIKALLTLDEVPSKLNEVRVADYLVPMMEDKGITFYQGILRLPPASCMTVSREGVRQWTYWSLDPERNIIMNSDEEYAEAFRELFVEAVRCRLRSAYPLGSLLSGGLDSSSIVCTARQLLTNNGNQPLHTFSAIFDDVPECDEREYINAVLAQGGYDPHFLHADRLSPLTDLERVFWHQDEAFFAPNLFMAWGLNRLAHQHGVRILMDGLDGDTTVSHGFAYLTELARAGRWVTATREIIALSRRFGLSPWVFIRRRLVKPLVPAAALRGWRYLRTRYPPMLGLNRIMNMGFLDRVGFEERYNTLSRPRSQPALTERESHLRLLNSSLLSCILEISNRASAAFSLETRFPFFDKRLIEFSLAIPPQQKLTHGWTRMVMRRAMQGILPQQVQWRGGKSNLSANFRRGLAEVDQKLIAEVILDQPEIIDAYVNVPALQKLYYQYQARRQNEDSVTLWRAATLALWLRYTGIST